MVYQNLVSVFTELDVSLRPCVCVCVYIYFFSIHSYSYSDTCVYVCVHVLVCPGQV